MVLALSIVGIMFVGLVGLSGICYYDSDIDSPGKCIAHGHEMIQNITNSNLKSVEHLLSFVASPSSKSKTFLNHPSDSKTSLANSSSNTEVVVVLSLSQFQKQLSTESRSELKRFLASSCTGCGSDYDWSPVKGSCLNYPNLAAYQTGARVISAKTYKICNETRTQKLIDPPGNFIQENADTVLKDAVTPGSSWAFKGNGTLDIKLTVRAIIIGLTVHHPPKTVLIPGYFSSAPKGIRFYGLKSEVDKNPVLFGQFEYSADGLSAQTFVVERWVETPYRLVRLEIISNHGNPVFTTLYRIEVHGIVVDEPWFITETKAASESKERLRLEAHRNDQKQMTKGGKACKSKI